MVQYEQFIRGGKTKFEDTKGVIMNPKSKKNRQCNGHKKKDKQNHYAEEQKYGYAKLINRHSNISDGQETLRRACPLYFTQVLIEIKNPSVYDLDAIKIKFNTHFHCFNIIK